MAVDQPVVALGSQSTYLTGVMLMVPTLGGRLQTRVFVLVVVGGLVVLAVTPLLVSGASIGDLYQATYVVLAAVLVLGLAWEFVYHFLQQFRWEKDWPTMFGLLTGINEGLLVWVLLSADVLPTGTSVSGGNFLIVFVSVWLVTWLWVNGPMRVPWIRWRFRGGRLV
ncbi:MAG TPA: hypothetical protein VK204_07190 [Nocardioidaceae bacterium]|nr:hypothetical protein [Nocardioidaceae bacterium]